MKTISITLEKATILHSALTEVLSNNELSFELAWCLEDIHASLQKSAERYQKAQQKIINEFGEAIGEPDEKGNQQFKIKDVPGFNDANKELNQAATEISIVPVEYDMLKNEAGLKLSPGLIRVLKEGFINGAPITRIEEPSVKEEPVMKAEPSAEVVEDTPVETPVSELN